MSLKNKKILITGGAGFLGSNLTRELLKKGAHVVIADNMSRRGVEHNFLALKKKYPKLKNHQVEINDIASVIVKEKPDLIYHFAAQVAVTTSVESPVSDFRINAEGTFTVARTAGEYNIPVIYSSTNKVYGDNVNRVPIREMKTRYDFSGKLARKGIGADFSIDAPHHTPYGCSKLAGELYVREYGGVVNRCSCMYGPHQYGIIDQGWVSYFIIQKLLGKPLTLFGDGKQVRDLLHADDVIRLFILQGEHLLSKKKPNIRGEVFAVGGGYKNTVSLLELCDLLDIKPKFGPWRPSDQKVFYCDTSKAQKLLGWTPKIGYKKGVEELLTWTKNHIEK
ncbi:hypothetical protein CL654_02925 [bacterium]|mgnify:CR=1 FL=1|nr:hypothetical protein [bacterium]|tara:strand:- start:34886 stop:35893 length:1008 start_codon:yes stop_codon:yes gene_type:complete